MADDFFSQPGLLDLLSQIEEEQELESGGGFKRFATFGGRQRPTAERVGARALTELGLPSFTATRLMRYRQQGLDGLTTRNFLASDVQNFQRSTEKMAFQKSPGFVQNFIQDIVAPFKTIGKYMDERDKPVLQRTINSRQLLAAAGEVFLYFIPPLKYARIVQGLTKAGKAAQAAGKTLTVAQRAKEVATAGLMIGSGFGALSTIREGNTDVNQIAENALRGGIFGAALMGVMPSVGAAISKYRAIHSKAALQPYIADPSLIDKLKISKEAKLAAKEALTDVDKGLFHDLDFLSRLPDEFRIRALNKKGISFLSPIGESLRATGPTGNKFMDLLDAAEGARRNLFVKLWGEKWYGRFPAKQVTLKKIFGATEVSMNEATQAYIAARRSVMRRGIIGEKAEREIKRLMQTQDFKDADWVILDQLTDETVGAIGKMAGRFKRDVSHLDRHSFWPTIPSEEDAVKLITDKGFKQKAVDYLIETGQAENKAIAELRLKDWVHGWQRLPGPHDVPKSPFLHPLPELDLSGVIKELDPETAMGIFVDSSLRDITFAESFGPTRKVAQLLGRRMEKESSPVTARNADRLLDETFGIISPEAVPRPELNFVRSLQAATLLGFSTTILQPTQLMNMATMRGLIPTFKALALHIANPTGKSVMYTRAAYQNVLSDIYDRAARFGQAGVSPTAQATGAVTRFAQKTLRFVRLHQTDGMMRKIGGDTADTYVREMYALAGKRTLSPAEQDAVKRLFEIDPTDFMAKAQSGAAIPEKFVNSAINNLSDFANIAYTPKHFPLWTFSPTGMVAFQFKRFSYAFTFGMMRGVWQQAVHGNYMPLIRALAIYPIGGTLLAAARDKLWNREPLEKDPTFWSQIADRMMATGILGLFGDAIRANRSGRTGIAGVIGGPTVGTIAEGWTAATDLASLDPEKNLMDRTSKLRRFFARRVPAASPVTTWLNRELERTALSNKEVRNMYEEIIKTNFGDQIGRLGDVEINDQMGSQLFDALNGDVMVAKVSRKALSQNINARKEFISALRATKQGLGDDVEDEALYLLDLLQKSHSQDEVAEVLGNFDEPIKKKAVQLMTENALDEFEMMEQRAKL